MPGKKKKKGPLVLIIMDGWGMAPAGKGNAITLAGTPNFNYFWKNYPHTTLHAAGEPVGVPAGMQGSSEVGHLNIGAGRIVYQSWVRINNAIKDKSFFKNKEFLEAIGNCKKHKSALHIMGLVQDQGVHAHQDHLFALLRLCRMQKFRDVWIHFLSDGRDTPPKSALTYLHALEGEMKRTRVGRIGTVIGRYYAMDRDNRWERTHKAYVALADAIGMHVRDARHGIEKAYASGETDEFITPKIVRGYPGMKDSDSVIFFNYRLDRTRQLTKAFVEPGFKEFKRKKLNLFYVGMTEYYSGMHAHVAFGPQNMKKLFGEIIAKAGLRQLRISETEKYAHVTFFFNGQIEKKNKGEDRILIPSPKVPTYDLEPEMSAYEITRRLVDELDKGRHDVIICNLVNCDMVGHTGKMQPIIKAVRTVDDCMGKIVRKALLMNGTVIITADHGNAEEKRGKNGEMLTAHTINDVPLILASLDDKLKNAELRNGKLADISPTMLQILGIKKPKEMTAESLIV
jgi:2,3-bisphosphoglycerate-independent phosphoglycerate mutase